MTTHGKTHSLGDITNHSNGDQWTSLNTIFNSNSAVWDYQGTDIKALTGNWQSTYTTVCANSAIWIGGTTIVTNVTSSGEFLTITVNGSARAIQLYIY